MRWILGAAAGIGFAVTAVQVDAATLRVFANSAHQTALQGNPKVAGSNLQEKFEKDTGITIDWETVPWPQMQQNLLRALSSGSSQFDVVMIESSWPSRDVLDKLVTFNAPAGSPEAKEFEAIFPRMRAAYTLDGQLKGIPIRSNPQIVHYNKAIFEARGIQEPKTFADLLTAAEKASFKRDDGAPVYGLALKPDEDIIAVVKAMGGNVVTDDFAVVVNSAETKAAIERLKVLFEKGAVPPNFFSMDATSVQTMMREGLVAMSLFGDNYFNRFNDPASSRIAGKAGFFAIPGTPPQAYAPAKVAFWAAALPKNGRPDNQEAAKTFIRYLASAPVQLQMALNGNGPVRADTLRNEAFLKGAPYASASTAALDNATQPLPIFEGTNQVRDIFVKEAVAAIIGKKPVDEALKTAETDIKAIVDKRRDR